MKPDPGAGPPPAASDDLALIPGEEVDALVRQFVEDAATIAAQVEEQNRLLNEFLAQVQRQV